MITGLIGLTISVALSVNLSVNYTDSLFNYTSKWDSQIKQFNQDTFSFSPEKIIYTNTLYINVSKDYSVGFEEICTHDIDKDVYASIRNSWEIRIKKTNIN